MKRPEKIAEKIAEKRFLTNFYYLRGVLPYRERARLHKEGFDGFKLQGLSDTDAAELIDMDQHITPYVPDQDD